jgi:hypothetical protein
MSCGAPETKLAAHAKSDGSMQRSSAGYNRSSTGVYWVAWLLLVLRSPLRTRYGPTQSIAEELSPLLFAYKPGWSSLLTIHLGLPIHFRSISQPNRPGFPSCNSSGCEHLSLPTMLGLNKPVDEPGASWPGITVGLFASFAGILYG